MADCGCGSFLEFAVVVKLLVAELCHLHEVKFVDLVVDELTY